MKAIKRVKAFQNIFDILLFATHATQPFTMKDLHDYVLDAPNAGCVQKIYLGFDKN
ncbi:hypothetical protein [Acinetobacter baumannii]